MFLDISDIILGIKKFSLFFIGAATPLIDNRNQVYDKYSTRNFSTSVFNIVLIKDVEQHITLPSEAKSVFITKNDQLGGDIYSKLGDSTVRAAVPLVNILDGTGCEINAFSYIIRPGNTTISLLSPKATVVCLSFYA